MNKITNYIKNLFIKIDYEEQTNYILHCLGKPYLVKRTRCVKCKLEQESLFCDECMKLAYTEGITL